MRVEKDETILKMAKKIKKRQQLLCLVSIQGPLGYEPNTLPLRHRAVHKLAKVCKYINTKIYIRTSYFPIIIDTCTFTIYNITQPPNAASIHIK